MEKNYFQKFEISRLFNNVFDEDDELSLLEDVVGSQTSMNDEQPGKLCVKNLKI